MTEISSAACILGAMALLTLPLKWLIGAAVAAGVHEAGHLLAIALVGAGSAGIRVGCRGAKIDAVFSKPWQELVCTAAGPAASLSLLLLASRFPRLGICGFVQGIYNLLPIYPLDGGRILACILAWMSPSRAEKITRRVGRMVSAMLLAAAFAAAVLGQLGMGLLLAWTAWSSGGLSGKIPCKTRAKAVQ